MSKKTSDKIRALRIPHIQVDSRLIDDGEAEYIEVFGEPRGADMTISAKNMGRLLALVPDSVDIQCHSHDYEVGGFVIAWSEWLE